MVALRIRWKSAFSKLFWLCTLSTGFSPTAIGYQDIASSLARAPGVSERWHQHLIASPFGTIHTATFSFARPIGTAMPEPVNFEVRSFDARGWPIEPPPVARRVRQSEYPTVNRRLKGDRLPLPQNSPASTRQETAPPLQPINAPSPRPPAAPPFPRPKSVEEIDSAPNRGRASNDAASHTRDGAGEADDPSGATFLSDADAAERDTRLYFGGAAIGTQAGLQQWDPGAVPVPAVASANADARDAALGAAAGDESGSKSPAARLGLKGRPRAQAEKCIADAVYFEARGEPVRGQMAVAQVVMNRVFSGRYPNNVCGVVYQNADRHLACQFTFACEGKDLSRIDEPDLWQQAKRIAKDMLDGKIWLAEVGHATHYHANWVRPSWVNEMAKLYKLGVHTFYRPRAWGDGSDAPVWGNVPEAAKAAKERDAAKSPEAAGKALALTARL